MPDRSEFKKKVWKIIIMANQNEINASKAQLDFICVEPECNGVIKFNLMELAADDFQVLCPKCHRPYAFDTALKTKLNKLKNLILALRDASDSRRLQCRGYGSRR